MTDSLERALQGLEFEVPDGLVDRAIARSTRTPARVDIGQQIRIATRMSLGRGAGLVVAILFVNLVAAYFAPRYGQALADSPIVGGVASPVLRYIGLDASQITRLNVLATSAGHTIKLVGAYADTERTVLLLEIDGQPRELPTKQVACCYAEATLVDQFGIEYQRIYSPDQMSATFKPLAGPASQLGARLTLHVTALHGLRPEFQTISGDWSLNLTLIQQPGLVLAVPDPVTANGITYTLKSARLSGKQLHIDFALIGPPIDEQERLLYGTRSPQYPDDRSFAMRFVNPRLDDGHGSYLGAYEWGLTTPRQGPMTGGLTVVLPGAGRYTLTFGRDAGAPSFQIDVP